MKNTKFSGWKKGEEEKNGRVPNCDLFKVACESILRSFILKAFEIQRLWTLASWHTDRFLLLLLADSA